MGTTLFIIPARKGSKGLPGKNTKILGSLPLISYSINFAKRNKSENDEICISTDDEEVIRIAKESLVPPPFIRPNLLANDNASTFDVIKHALQYYLQLGKKFDNLVLLQPTSPFRLDSDLIQMRGKYIESNAEMVVSVKHAKENPYFTLFKENEEGFIAKYLTEPIYTRRQDCPPCYAYNGSIYLVNCMAFEKKGNFNFDKIVKHVMPEERSVDIDTITDWLIAEYYLNHTYENS
ncbi:acylneuraminate cytidylyltransferase family protein [Sediminibacterium sp.]|uniref:acylneuraminate cytidylyltransferase family protein n=1 Tax=Sediminibacterium sp. TaxID=1917865 RepID=UPI0025CF487E|nr:acylneuraminate cytidylyltransferase family protein [Sediminibacterium sp.]